MDIRRPQQEGDVLLHRVEALEFEVTRLRATVETLALAERHRDLVAQLPRQEDLRLSPSAHLAAREFVEAGSGFHSLEYGDSDVAFRWTGPESSTRLIFWVDRSRPIQVRIGVLSLGASAPGTPVLVEVDGVDHVAAYDAAGKALVVAPVAPRPQLGPTVVVIHSPAMAFPHSADGDRRLVGIAVSRVDLTPV